MKKVQPGYSFQVDDKTLAKMKDFYAPFQEQSPSAYIDLFARGEGVTVSIFKRNKEGKVTASFQGPKAIEEASLWDPSAHEKQGRDPQLRSLPSPSRDHEGGRL